MTVTNDEIVRLANKGWELGRVSERGPLDEATEKSVAEFKLAMSRLDPADLLAAMVVSKLMSGPYTLTTERGFEARLQSIADHLGATMEVLSPESADGSRVIARDGRNVMVLKFTPPKWQ
jgi:hypothetical protein